MRCTALIPSFGTSSPKRSLYISPPVRLSIGQRCKGFRPEWPASPLSRLRRALSRRIGRHLFRQSPPVYDDSASATILDPDPESQIHPDLRSNHLYLQPSEASLRPPPGVAGSVAGAFSAPIGAPAVGALGSGVCPGRAKRAWSFLSHKPEGLLVPNFHT